jgi:hypothetical protein
MYMLIASIDPITPRQLRNKSRPNIEKLLAAANTLNQIWCEQTTASISFLTFLMFALLYWNPCSQLPDIREQIEMLAQKHEESNINIDYLESTLAKVRHLVPLCSNISTDAHIFSLATPQCENELAALIKAKQAAPARLTTNTSDKIAKDIDRELAEVKALEKEIREKEKRVTFFPGNLAIKSFGILILFYILFTIKCDALDDQIYEQRELLGQEEKLDDATNQFDDLTLESDPGQDKVRVY